MATKKKPKAATQPAPDPDSPAELARKLADHQKRRQAEFKAKLTALCDEYGMGPQVQQTIVFLPTR